MTTSLRRQAILADQTDQVWDPEWSHILFVNITTDISSAAVATVSVHKNYLRVTILTTDATPLKHNKLFNDRTGKNSLNSTFINTQETLNRTRNFAQQDVPTPSHM